MRKAEQEKSLESIINLADIDLVATYTVLLSWVNWIAFVTALPEFNPAQRASMQRPQFNRIASFYVRWISLDDLYGFMADEMDGFYFGVM